ALDPRLRRTDPGIAADRRRRQRCRRDGLLAQRGCSGHRATAASAHPAGHPRGPATRHLPATGGNQTAVATAAGADGARPRPAHGWGHLTSSRGLGLGPPGTAATTPLVLGPPGSNRWRGQWVRDDGGVRRPAVPLARHLLRVRDLIDRAYAEQLDISALARSASVSTAYFSRSFKAAFGETPHQYLMSRRMERAKALLRPRNLPAREFCALQRSLGCL